jgi:poly(A)-specific ribonuclease
MCEVISSNFFELFPLIIQQIDQSSFLAIDTEFSSIDSYSSSIKTIEQYYKQRSNFIKQITIFQFGLAIFSRTSDQHKYVVNIYNFYLHPTSINSIDVKYFIQSSSIKFLSEYKFDFNKCFYSGISFLNQTQENHLFNQKEVRDLLLFF